MYSLDICDPQTLVLECSICTEQYGTDFDHTPRSLRCGHTFSSDCLLKILTSRGVKCPICSIEHLLSSPDVSQIPVNYAVLELLRNVTETSREPPVDENTPRCGVCNQKNSQVVCIDCQPGVKFLFCHPCDQREHNRPFKPVQGHRRYPIDRVPAPVFTCSCHHDKQATLYSENFREFACEECKRAPDWLTRSTMFVPIPDVLNRLRSQSQELNLRCLNVMSQLKDAKHKVKHIINRLDPSADKAKLEIQTKFGAIIDLIQSQQQWLLDYVDNESTHRKQRLQEQLEQIQTLVKIYRDTHAHDDLDTLASKSDLDFMQEFREKIKSPLVSEDRSLYQPPVTEEIPFVIAKDIELQLKMLGAVGGGIIPTELECIANSKYNNMMQINWLLPETVDKVQIEYEHIPDVSPFNRDGNQIDSVYFQNEPHMQQVIGTKLSAFIDYLCPGYQYRFRIRSANAAGWGMWSKPVVGRCGNFPITIHYTKSIYRIQIPVSGCYRITAKGAKAADGRMHCGGRGAVITATFYLKAGDVLIILCGGTSSLHIASTGGGGGTFVAVNEISRENLLIAAGGGGGTRRISEDDYDGCDASLEPNGTDGQGREHGKGGVYGNAGKDAIPDNYQTPYACWGHGGAGFLQDSTTALSFLKGGCGGQCGGFGGGGAIGQYGGGGGGGYSGGGGGRGGGGGGSYVRDDGANVKKAIGNTNYGSVMVEKLTSYPCHPAKVTAVLNSDCSITSYSVHHQNLMSSLSRESSGYSSHYQKSTLSRESSGYSSQYQRSTLSRESSDSYQVSSSSSTYDSKGGRYAQECCNTSNIIPSSECLGEKPISRIPNSHDSPLIKAVHYPPPTSPIAPLSLRHIDFAAKAESDSSDCSVESPSLSLVSKWIVDDEKSTEFRIATEKAEVPFLHHHLLECDNSYVEYTIKDHDITVRIPEGAVPAGKNVNFEIGVAMHGPFMFPGSSRPISPIIWLCFLEDFELKKPFQLTLPHFLTGLKKERVNYHEVNFAKANHSDFSVENKYIFNHCDSNPLFASTKYRSYGVLKSTLCCFYCLLAKNTPELARDAGYCLARIENVLSPRRNEVYFAAIFFLDTCIRALEEQFPHESGYRICRYDTFKFDAEELDVIIAPCEPDRCVITLEPMTAKIRASDIDFWNFAFRIIKLQHEKNIYPPRVKMTVVMRAPDHILKIPIKIKGCSCHNQLDVELAFPLLDIPHLSSSTSGSSGPLEQHSRTIVAMGDKPKLRNVFKKLFPLAKDWKTIGCLLGVERHVLDSIKRDEEGVRDCLNAMLSEWLKQVDPPPTWTDIVDAVEEVDSSKAEEIRKYLAC